MTKPRLNLTEEEIYQRVMARIAELMVSDPELGSRDGIELDHLTAAVELYERLKWPTPSTLRREYHVNGTYWSGAPTVDIPCDFCTRPFVDHDPRTHACPDPEAVEP